MTHIYRETDPVSGRWTGNSGGIDLSAFQIDQNFYQILAAIATLQANESFTVSIAYITQTGSTFTFHMNNHTLQGPFTIPQSTFLDRGAWAPFTLYAVNDTFHINGTLYLVIFAHTSVATFSAGANDGMGHNYYSPMLSVPGSALPTGGAASMMLAKVDGHDFHVYWKYPVPVGGVAGQFLAKVNGSDFNMHWTDAATSMESLSNFTYSSPHSVGQVIQWNGSHWTNTTLTVTFSEISDILLTSPHSVGDVLTWDGLHWVNSPTSGGRFSTVTTLASSGTVVLDGTLGDVFEIAPTGDVLLQSTDKTAGAHITLIVSSNNSSGFKVTFDSGSFIARGPLTLSKQSGFSVTISFTGDGFFYWETSRTGEQTNVALTSTGVAGMNPYGSNTDIFTLTPTGNVTINSTPPGPGRRGDIVVTTAGTTPFTITFGSNFKTTGTLSTGSVSGKVFTVSFISDGTNYNEISRTTAM